jgi:hypothetical protein
MTDRVLQEASIQRTTQTANVAKAIRTCPELGPAPSIECIRSTKTFYDLGSSARAINRVGTIFQYTKLPLRKWFMAIWLIIHHRIHATRRSLGITQKTGWLVQPRLRNAPASYASRDMPTSRNTVVVLASRKDSRPELDQLIRRRLIHTDPLGEIDKSWTSQMVVRAGHP